MTPAQLPLRAAITAVALVTLVTLASPPIAAARVVPTLQEVVATLVADASKFGAFLGCPTVGDRACEHPQAVAMTVIDLDTGETASVNGDVLMISASAVKAVWVAAGVRELGLDAVEPLQLRIFKLSDNDAAGRLIDLLGPRCNAGIDRLNTIVTTVFDRTDTMLNHWYQCRRALTTKPPWGVWSESFTTTNDLAAFWGDLAQGELLDPLETAAVLQWAAVERSATNELLVARLPDGTGISYKSGWKPLSRARISGGVITAPDGSRLAIAIAFLAPGSSYSSGALRWSAYASCVATYAVMHRTHTCGRPTDPTTLTPIETAPTRTRVRHKWII